MNAQEIAALLSEQFGDRILESKLEEANPWSVVEPSAILDVCRTVCESLHQRASAEIETIERGREAMLDLQV